MTNVYTVVGKLENVIHSGNQYSARCPIHDDEHNSLSVSEGNNGKILLCCHRGCPTESIIDKLGLQWEDLFDKPQELFEAVYDYRDRDGALLFQTVRYPGKQFPQRRPVGSGWEWNMHGVTRVLYRLPELINADPADPVFVVEGEKDADNLADIGLVATTNPLGAGKWSDDYSPSLKDRHVVILPDNDDPGRNHAIKVAESVYPFAASVKVLKLPGLAEKGDVSDWLQAGGSKDSLLGLVAQAAKYSDDGDTTSTEAAPTTKSTRDSSKSQVKRLLNIVGNVQLFHTPTGEAFATLRVKGHQETYRIGSRSFGQWLSHEFHQTYRSSPGAQAVQEAKQIIEYDAVHEREEHPVFTRIARVNGKVYVDLCDDNWQVVEITSEGRKIIKHSPVRFVRQKGMLKLPEPEPGGTMKELRPFLNLRDEHDWALICGWLVGAWRGESPYPILVLHGEQGTAKSTATKLLHKLIDPNVTLVRGAPRSEQDLMIAANNSWLVVGDNLSYLPNWLSDALCRLSTGGGTGTRLLYSDAEESTFNAARPAILNGINEVATRGDLLDRALVVELQPIPESRRRTESEYWAEFERVYPRILGAMCDSISTALRNWANTILLRPPRMADFAQWAAAAEPSWGAEEGTFLAAYTHNRSEGTRLALESSKVAVKLQDLMASRDSWHGTATELLSELNKLIGMDKPEGWPKDARGLSEELTDFAPNLRITGLSIDKGHTGTRRLITIVKAQDS